MSQGSPIRLAVVLLALSGTQGRACHADFIQLKTGGELRGSLVKGTSTSEPELTIVSISGATITVPRTEVEIVQSRSPLVEEYITRSREIPHTVAAHQELADWCVSRQLKAQRVEQLELLLELEPDNEIVHRSLGHIRHEGQWMSRDDAMAKQGYVKHNGKYITQLEFELLEKSSAERAAEQEWYPKVKQWTTWLVGRDARRASEAVTALRDLREPNAVAALWNYLGEHKNIECRKLFVEVASQIPGPLPARKLSRFLLNESDEATFRLALSAINPEQKDEVLKNCLPGLKDKSNDVVQRAALVLEKFGDERVIPELIDALITTHRVKALIPAQTISVGFGISPSGTPSMLPAGTTGLVPSEIEMLNRAGQLPYGYTINDTGPKPPMKSVTVKAIVRNTRVLEALKAITGEDFGYDQRDWQKWWTLKQAAS